MRTLESLKSLAGQTAAYGLSSVLGRVLNYLLVPLYTSVFLPGEYGVVTELYAYMAFLNVVFTYGMETAYFRFGSDKENAGKIYSNVLASIVITTFVFGGFIYFLSGPIANFIGYPDQTNLIKWTGLILSIDAIVAIPFAQLRLEGKAVRFASLKLGNIVLNIGFNLLFLVYCPWVANHPDAVLSINSVLVIYDEKLGVEYVFIANLIANAVYILAFFSRLIKVNFHLNREILKPIYTYAFPLLILGLAGVTNEMLSRALLKHLLPNNFYPHLTNLEALGIFGACYKLSVFMTLSVQAFRFAFEPFFFNQSKEKGSPELFAQIANIFIIFGSLCWLFISLILPEIAPIFLRQEAYLEGLRVVPLLLGGGLFLGVYYNLSLWYKLTDKTWYGAIIAVVGAMITILLNVILIPKMGFMGSAWAAFMTYFSMMVISYIWGKSHYFVPYRILPAIIYMAIVGITIFAFSQTGSTLFRYVIGGFGTIFLGIIIYIFEKNHLLSRSKN